MAGVNKVILLGRIGLQPEMKTLENGNKVCNFSLATSESYKDSQGQKQERTEWHNIVLWGKLAELANTYLSKGREVYIEGKIQTRKWQDQSGNDRYTTDIVGTNMSFVGGKNDSTVSSTPNIESNGNSNNNEDDNLPF